MRILSGRLSTANSYAEFEQAVKSAVGKEDLLEFLRLDLGRALRIDPGIVPYRLVRIIAGNPLIMKEMTRHVPDAGSYAPVTLLIYERDGKVYLAYDKIESLLANTGNAAALKVAHDLDSKVIELLRNAAEA